MLHIFIKKKAKFHHGDSLNGLNGFGIYIIFIKIMVKYIWMGKQFKFMHHSNYAQRIISTFISVD